MTSQYNQEKLEHTPWVEKYRPKNLDDVAAQEHAVKVLKKTLQLANLPHMLFYGPPGTGKTSTVLALAKQLYGPRLYKLRVLELNASDERGISIVRLKIKNFARLSVSNPTQDDLANYPCPPYKIIVLDEADSMTNDAQAALRRTMENYSGVTRFCLICNYITRIIDPLALRCLKFRFRLLDSANALARLAYIADLEGVRVALPDVYDALVAVSNGDLRKAITYLQSAARLDASLQSAADGEDVDESGSPGISAGLVREIAGVVDQSLMVSVVQAIKQKNTAFIASKVHEVVLQGWSAQQVSDQLHDLLILDDALTSAQKNAIASALFDTDRRLNNGTDEHIQLLNLAMLISSVM